MAENDIQEDKFDLREGDIEWLTPVGTETPPWVLPTDSLEAVLDFMGVPQEYRRDRTRELMGEPMWANAPRNVKLDAIRLVAGGSR